MAQSPKSEFIDNWHVQPTFRVSESFDQFVKLNPDLRVEQNANGEIVIMAPTGAESANRNAAISAQLWNWASKFGGKTFDSSVLFTFPNGAKRGPDASWISQERWNEVSKQDREYFARVCPDFAIELRSPSDRLVDLIAKMDEYIANGIKLGWLLDPFERTVRVYLQNHPPLLLESPSHVSCESVLPGFVLELKDIWAQATS